MLAALATVARPGLNVVGTRQRHEPGANFDVVAIVDSDGGRWVMRAPRHDAAGAALEGELALLEELAGAVDAGQLPFDVPRPQGFAPLPEGGRAMLYPELVGPPLRPDQLSPSSPLLRSMAKAIAAIHNLPHSIVAATDLPVYDAEGYRERRLAEVDEAARTGHLPQALLLRWEEALEDVALWRFAPTCVHGDLAADHVVVDGDRVVGIVDWSQAQVADPADDLAWLLAQLPTAGVQVVLRQYADARRSTVDDGLAARARLAGELAIARWLMHGVRMRSNELIEDAIGMLNELAQTLAQAPAIGLAAPAPVLPQTGDDDYHEDRPVHHGDPMPLPDDSPTTELPLRD